MSTQTTSRTWAMIHSERAALADTLAGLTDQQWSTPSLCDGWTVRQLAAHVLAGAEQTGPHFIGGMVRTGFRFNTLMRHEADRLAALSPAELVARLQARTTTHNHPPAPLSAMLGEVVVHGEDLRRPLGLTAPPDVEASAACLEMYKGASFPVGGKKRIRGLRLVATDTDWSTGEGPEVTGPAISLVLAMTGRAAALVDLDGPGLGTLRDRVTRG
jgi:uncharacterized protein (TIGR03083 family)